MKTIKNLLTEIELPPDNHNARLSDLILLCLDRAPQSGFTISEIRSRARIQNAIEAHNDEIGSFDLEDADYDKARECVSSMSWGIRSPELEKLYAAFGL